MHPAWKIATRTARGTIVGLMLMGTCTACDSTEAGLTSPAPPTHADPSLEMVVENQFAAPVEITLLTEATRTSVGLVPALTRTTLDIGRFVEGEPELIRIQASAYEVGEGEAGEVGTESVVLWVSHFVRLQDAEWVRLTVADDFASSNLEVGMSEGSSQMVGGRPVSLPLSARRAHKL